MTAQETLAAIIEDMQCAIAEDAAEIIFELDRLGFKVVRKQNENE